MVEYVNVVILHHQIKWTEICGSTLSDIWRANLCAEVDFANRKEAVAECMALYGLNPSVEGPRDATNAPYDIGQMDIIMTHQTMDIECRSKPDKDDIF